MKLCMSSSGSDISSALDPRFGRCQYFLFIDTETLNVEALGNPAFSAGGGAGIQAAQTVVNNGAGAIISGNIGPNAFQALQAGGVRIITGAAGQIRDVVDRFNKGELQYTVAPTVDTHHGTGR